MFFVQNPMIQMLEKSIDAGALRQKVIADNIANLNTPNFKKSEVQFEENLRAALKEQGNNLPLKTAHSKHIGEVPEVENVKPQVVKNESTSMRADGNNVDIDEEMVNLAMNTVKFNTSVQEINDRLGLLRTAITGGRR